jgi:hypothetical protein
VCDSRPPSPGPSPAQCLIIALTDSSPQPSSPGVVWKPSTYAVAMAEASSTFSPKVPSTRSQRGSVARSICGLSAVPMPSARYSAETACAKVVIVSVSNVAARPRFEGQREMSPDAL